MGLCEAIVDATLRRAGGRRVSAVRVRATGHPVDPGVVEQGFRLAAAGTVAEGAALDLVVEPPAVRCRSCDETSPVTTATALAACPRCGGLDVTVPAGDGLVVESIATTDNEPASARGGGRRGRPG
ncbi:hydrogenase maturation nickel metallochaperone HypA/HybF [Thermomonospora echinospora]|nr:hydrogenase maturation nickel metallochaperone HypA [Thermomonospora echinospora]